MRKSRRLFNQDSSLWRYFGERTAVYFNGERNDITRAEQLIKNFSAEAVLADKGYDADAFIRQIESRNSKVVIPSKAIVKSRASLTNIFTKNVI